MLITGAIALVVGFVYDATLQFVLPLIAFALDYAGDLQTDQTTRWLLRGLGVIPIVFLYLILRVPLSRFTPACAEPSTQAPR